MKVKKEIKNGYFIFISIGTYFLLMEFLGLSNVFYLRLLNVFFVLYAVNDTLKSRVKNGNTSFLHNIKAALTTSLVGVTLSILGLLIYSYMRGGDAYIHNLSESFLFGGHPSINMYCFSLFFEGIASSVIVTLLLVLYYNDKFAAD
ncbi:hypothetical protein [Flavobacterium gilvum]|uniref:Uncharacterized protein n=1 Tax=Flavobacterium gilvum TaxID=1492737 RepID=A0AAC9I7I8_9FLAO|nr:hypothetical protein [Flavobacterium gilvum]AOW11257.1 hypothetical protein EM308_05095 [Flavobacterium gilvum]KFC60915.1 hypothetical protein FEM08_03050 [Flavobacterium gilvum]